MLVHGPRKRAGLSRLPREKAPSVTMATKPCSIGQHAMDGASGGTEFHRGEHSVLSADGLVEHQKDPSSGEMGGIVRVENVLLLHEPEQTRALLSEAQIGQPVGPDDGAAIQPVRNLQRIAEFDKPQCRDRRQQPTRVAEMMRGCRGETPARPAAARSEKASRPASSMISAAAAINAAVRSR